MLVSIMTNQLTLTGSSRMLDGQLSTAVKYMAPHGPSRHSKSRFFCAAKSLGLKFCARKSGKNH